MIIQLKQNLLFYFITSFIEIFNFKVDGSDISIKSGIEIHPIDKIKLTSEIENSPFFLALSKTFTKDELIIILKDFFWLDIIGAIKESINSAVGLVKNVIWIFNNPIEAVKKGISNIKELPAIICSVWNSIKQMSFKELLKCAAQIGVFALSAYMGFSVPDKDISIFGIGGHRNFFTHSIGPALLFSLCMKLGMRFVQRIQVNYPGESEWLAFLQTILQASQIGFNVGIAAHLSKDLLIDGNQTIRGIVPRSNIPEFLRENYRFDKGYLAANIFIANSNLQTTIKKIA